MHERDVVSGMAVFVAVVETGSLAAAARRCGLTPSAVSKLVSRLEDRFGTRLLRRSTRSLAVTEAGRVFYDRSSTVLEDLRAVEQELASTDAAPRGLVRVSAPLMLGQARVVPALLAFLAKTPAVTMDLELTDRLVDLVGERVDVAVRITPEPPPSFVAKRVGALERVLCASPGYLRRHAAPRDPKDLAGHACLLLASARQATIWKFTPKAEGAEPERVRVAGRLRVTNTQSLYDATLAGLGIAELPRYLVQADLEARRLVRVLPSFDGGENGVFVVYPAGPMLPSRVRAVVTHLVSALMPVLGEAAPASRRARS